MDAFVARPGGDDDNIAGAKLDPAPSFSAEKGRHAASRNPQNLVCACMEMIETVHAVPPALFPAMRSEKHFKNRRRVVFPVESYWRAIEKKGAIRIVWSLTIVSQLADLRFAVSYADIFRVGPRRAGHDFKGFFDFFLHWELARHLVKKLRDRVFFRLEASLQKIFPGLARLCVGEHPGCAIAFGGNARVWTLAPRPAWCVCVEEPAGKGAAAFTWEGGRRNRHCPWSPEVDYGAFPELAVSSTLKR
jgi:hypothetical protein